MKRILLSSLALLWLCCAFNTSAQTLTIRQMLDLNKMEQMQKDAYLVKRGWRFAKTAQENDSTYKTVWRFFNTKDEMIGEAVMWQHDGQHEAFSYSTVLRPAFDAIRATVLAVPMEVVGTNNTQGMQTFYRDTEYTVVLGFQEHEGRTEYNVYLQKHGLTKAYRRGENGETVAEWIQVPEMTEAQKRYYDAFIDSVERKRAANRAAARPAKVAPKKPRK